MKLKMIINPVSGQHSAHTIKDSVIQRLKQRYGLNDADIFYTNKENRGLETSFFENCDSLVVAGGDGTLHYAVNTVKRLGIDIPLAYLPTGTVNDFGNSLKLPRTCDAFCSMLENGLTQKIDIGLAGEEYFHYLVAGGAMNSLSYTTNQTLKNVMGDKAYYLSAVPRLAKLLSGTRIQIECDGLQEDHEALLYLITNSPIVGGIKGMVPNAKMDDGHLHVLVIKKNSLLSTLQLLLEIRNRTHLNHPDVLYFKTRRLIIKQYGEDIANVGIDGEIHSSSQFEINVIPQGLTVMVSSDSYAA
ncbi:diacylglycerol/lipid kinase family protein [Saccharibacillus alkalitolerans]|uniref:YegS/Rv2252/BmrU family lipid kinase n=1 Tax=Saccharibacillus alkalitolerans TaxID=2705290 RepID=A0ABX0F3V2_9BACL|nr:YegS/Rv2252/BmrU family lipid kinase [Saccharibacillus alkalitolerans]NGZ74679.1 YegS/Rv2252/BmrU family lipid kinase [Saccharibacillus alkalitolerans]